MKARENALLILIKSEENQSYANLELKKKIKVTDPREKALVTELVYHYIHLSYGLPILVGVLFTLLHAVIQAYVLTMLTSLFYGEVSEPAHENK